MPISVIHCCRFSPSSGDLLAVVGPRMKGSGGFSHDPAIEESIATDLTILMLGAAILGALAIFGAL